MNIKLNQTVEELFSNNFNQKKVLYIKDFAYIYPVFAKPIEIKNPKTGELDKVPERIYVTSMVTKLPEDESSEHIKNFEKLLADANIDVVTIEIDVASFEEGENFVVDKNGLSVMSLRRIVRPERTGRDPVTLENVVVPGAVMYKPEFSNDFVNLMSGQLKIGLDFVYPEGKYDQPPLPISVSFRLIKSKLNIQYNLNIKEFPKAKNLVESLMEFEKFIGYPLPLGYIGFLKEYNGGLYTSDHCTFCTQDPFKQFTFIPHKLESLFGFFDDGENPQYSLMEINKKYASQLPKDVILIGKLKGSGFLAITLSMPSNYIYVWDDKFYERSKLLIKLNPDNYPHLARLGDPKADGVFLNSFYYVTGVSMSNFFANLYVSDIAWEKKE